MANSQRFRDLKSELNRLRKHLLPQQWDPTGLYSERKLDRTRAYKVLTHAEIEFFIENIALDVVEREYHRWSLSNLPTYIIICLLASAKIGWQDVEAEDIDLVRIDPPKIKKDDDSIHQMIERAIDQYRGIIKDNNGIKTPNLKRILMPLGIAISDLDQTWLNNMNSFGGRRGAIAHTSRRGITNLPDPRTEKDAVDNLLVGLKELDLKINAL